VPVNPQPFLHSLAGKPIIARLKWGLEYRGFLVSVDAYMNLQLANSEEWIGGEFKGNLGEVLIRYISVTLVIIISGACSFFSLYAFFFFSLFLSLGFICFDNMANL
jgi:small nuclear ribonucleoprotein F